MEQQGQSKKRKQNDGQQNKSHQFKSINIPTLRDMSNQALATLARTHWAKRPSEEEDGNNNSSRPSTQFDPEIVSKIYVEEKLESSKDAQQSIMLLEFSSYLENYLWPHYHHEASTLPHHLSILVMVNEKFREGVSAWDTFNQNPHKFQQFLRNIFLLNTMYKLNIKEKTIYIQFLVHCLKSLEVETIRKSCLSLMSLPCWCALDSGRRELEFYKNPKLSKRWDELFSKKPQLAKSLEATFIPNLTNDYFNVLYSIKKEGPCDSDSVYFCERFCELLIDLLAQLPTRRFLFAYFADQHITSRNKLSDLSHRSEGRLFNQLNQILVFYMNFEINEHTGNAPTKDEMLQQHYNRLCVLQRIAFKHFPELQDLVMTTVASIETRKKLRAHLDKLTTERLHELCSRLRLIGKANSNNSEENQNMSSDDSQEKEKENLQNKKQKQKKRKIDEIIEQGDKQKQQQQQQDDDNNDDEDDEDDQQEEQGDDKLQQQEEKNPGNILKKPTRAFLMEIILSHHEKRVSQMDSISSMPLYPTEDILWDNNVVPSELYFGERVLALPKLNLQFLTYHDYLFRNFNLFRLESTYEIRDDINDCCQRVQPSINVVDGTVRFNGWARMGHPIVRFEIKSVKKPRLGEVKPAKVIAEISIDLAPMKSDIQREWEGLKQHDVLFLLSFYDTIDSQHSRIAKKQKLTEERAIAQENGQKFVPREMIDAREWYGLRHVRGCEIVAIKDVTGEVVEDGRFDTAQKERKGTVRILRVELDAAQYYLDKLSEKDGKADIYTTFNLVMRRKAKENNFKAVLSTIRDLMTQNIELPNWLNNIFLGYGDPTKSTPQLTIQSTNSNTNLENDPENNNNNNENNNENTENNSNPVFFDFYDTFINQEHLKECFPNALVKFSEAPVRDDGSNPKVEPPFKCSFSQDSDQEIVTAQCYIPLSLGPYPQLKPPQNKVRYTPVQVKAIRSGMNIGLTMVVGPPGTGKTDVAVQIISNIYHSFPNERTLLVTHSNHALNDLFEKIAERDIDERHLLRLGRGEELLETTKDFSKWGRVNYMLERRLLLLSHVDRLARGLSVLHDVSQSCETAAHFNLYHVIRRWEEFNLKCKQFEEKKTETTIVVPEEEEEKPKTKDDLIKVYFPFTFFFHDAPQPLFVSNYEIDIKKAESCYRFIQNIFEELEDCRAFELLRTAYDRSNYLLTKQAKIIAMTCTHAGITYSNLIDLSFEYDNVLMEESAQILEIETFIPLLLQKNDKVKSRLKRVILLGDHNQLPPVVKNMAFQKYSHLDQSLFTRFVRLGIPYIELNQQGRARSSLAALYRWRYKELNDLPHVQTSDMFALANTGFVYDYQVINVENYQGKGETEPTPHFIQNLGEAEYIVAVYQYMRLLGVPASKISIITTYQGQKHLIKDVIRSRCTFNPLFGEPAKITTTDKFQGQQNDFILLSLVRTKVVGHIRDIRRLIVSMSRARFGLYVFCRQSIFSDCYELSPTFSILNQRPNKLLLVQGETYPTKRRIDEMIGSNKIMPVEDVFHLGSIVAHLAAFKLQQQKYFEMQQLKELNQQKQKEQEEQDDIERQMIDEQELSVSFPSAAAVHEQQQQQQQQMTDKNESDVEMDETEVSQSNIENEQKKKQQAEEEKVAENEKNKKQEEEKEKEKEKQREEEEKKKREEEEEKKRREEEEKKKREEEEEEARKQEELASQEKIELSQSQSQEDEKTVKSPKGKGKKSQSQSQSQSQSSQEVNDGGIGAGTDFEKMKVPELKAELQKLSLSTEGKKAVLVQRLRDHFSSST